MEEHRPDNVPYVVYSDTVANYHWIIRKLVIALVVSCILGLLATVGSNMAWLWVFQSYDYSTEETVTTVDSEGDGIANYTGGNGGVNIGEGDS